MPTVVDLFAGQGGFITGFNMVPGWRHLAAVEIEEKHCAILRVVYPDVRVITNDVSKVNWDVELRGEAVDCVVGGPPCQPFSRGSNHRNGWKDAQNGIPAFVTAVQKIQPAAFLLENVPRVWWKEHRHHITDVIQQFIQMGYKHTVAVTYDAADFGAPCHRRRLFVFGTKHEHKLPVKTHAKMHVGARDYLVPLLEAKEPDGAPLPEWVKSKIKGGRGDIIIDCKQGNKMGRQYVSLDEPCFTLVASQGIRHRIRWNGQYFRMRAGEAAALQGMDARCTVEGIGNAVNAWQAEAWANSIKQYLESISNLNATHESAAQPPLFDTEIAPLVSTA